MKDIIRFTKVQVMSPLRAHVYSELCGSFENAALGVLSIIKPAFCFVPVEWQLCQKPNVAQ